MSTVTYKPALPDSTKEEGFGQGETNVAARMGQLKQPVRLLKLRHRGLPLSPFHLLALFVLRISRKRTSLSSVDCARTLRTLEGRKLYEFIVYLVPRSHFEASIGSDNCQMCLFVLTRMGAPCELGHESLDSIWLKSRSIGSINLSLSFLSTSLFIFIAIPHLRNAGSQSTLLIHPSPMANRSEPINVSVTFY